MRRLLLTLPVLVLASGAWGQDWTQLPLPPCGLLPPDNGYSVGSQITSYFINPEVGFTFSAAVSSNYMSSIDNGLILDGSEPNLAVTMDGGETWKSMPFFDSVGCSLAQLDFTNQYHGYAATYCYDGDSAKPEGGIYETFDQGRNWRKISMGSYQFSGIYTTKGMLFASAINNGLVSGEILFSSDDGATWDSITSVQGIGSISSPQFQFVYGNKDSIVATVLFQGNVGDFSTYLVYSRNLGQNWQAQPLETHYPDGLLSLFIPPHSCSIFAEKPNSFYNDTYNFLETQLVPFGSWFTSIDSIETGAWIAGNACAMYISNAGTPIFSSGAAYSLFRSTNIGSRWVGVGDQLSGPNMTEIDDIDWQNISVVGYGAVVYVGSLPWSFFSRSFGISSLWKTTDGGNGTLSAAALAPVMALAHAPFLSGDDTLSIPSCEASQMAVTNFNIGCSLATFDSATIAGLDPSEYSITSTHYCGCTHVPDSSFITLTPKHAGVRNVTVHFHYTDDEYNQIDTTLPVVLDVKAGGVAVPVSLTLGSSTMVAHAGDTIEIPVYLTSDSTVAFADTTSISLPFALDTNVLKVVSFIPAFGGSPVDSLTYGGGTGASSAMLTVPLQIKDLTISGKTLIGTLRCVVYLADTLETSISLAGASINSSGAGCIALSTDLGAVNIAITGCGDSTLLRFMRGGTVFSIASVTPNPAQNVLSVRLENPRGEAGRYQIFNSLGAPEIAGNCSGNAIEFSISPLPNGIYLLQVTSPDGFVSSRRFIVER